MSKLLLRTALAATCLAGISAAAFAAVDTTFGTEPVLDQLCSDLQKPSDESGFTSMAVDVDVTSTQSAPVDFGIISTVGIGTPTYTISNYRDARVNGQSVNIHALVDKAATYKDGALVTVKTVITVTTTRSASCHVHKPNPGNADDPLHADYQVAPPGLQTDDRVSESYIGYIFGTRTYTIPGPWVDPNGTITGEQAVICISPAQPPPKGTWRGQNGYTNQLGRTCSTAWHNELGSSQPTASLPPV